MDRFTEGLLRDYGVRAILGKGGMSRRTAELMKQYGAVYLSVTGGAAAMETLQIEEIENVFWEDLMPECIWQIRFKGFGPLTVGIDAHGGNLQMDVQAQANQKAAELMKKMGLFDFMTTANVTTQTSAPIKRRFQSYRGSWASLRNGLAQLFCLLIPVKIYTGLAAKG